MALGWGKFWGKFPKDDDEPTARTTHRKVTGMRIEPGGAARVTLAPDLGEPTPYADPDELQDDVIEPTAVYKPWLPGTAWEDCIIETWTDEV